MFEIFIGILVGIWWVIKGLLVALIILLPSIMALSISIGVWGLVDAKYGYGFIDFSMKTAVWILGIALVCSPLFYELDNIKKDYYSYERKLYAFEDNQGFYIRGGMFSSSGSDELVYYYTLKNSDNSFKSYRAKTNMSKIYYTDKEPYVKYNKSNQYLLDGKWHSFITRKLIPRSENKEFYSLESIEFYVPKGSVQNSYNSDLK